MRAIFLSASILASTIFAADQAIADAWLVEKTGLVEQSQSGHFVPLDAFVRIIGQPVVKIHAESSATILYESGRKEKWRGSVSIRLQQKGADLLDKAGKDAGLTIVQEDGEAVADTVKVSSLMNGFRTGRIAGIRMRDSTYIFASKPTSDLSKPDQQLLRETISSLQASADQSDAEFERTFLRSIAVFSQFEQYGSLKEAIAIALKRNPTNTLAISINAYLTSQNGPVTSPMCSASRVSLCTR